MRILMTADAIGGVWTYTLELARALCGRDDRVFLAVLGGAPSAEQRRDAQDIAGLTLFESEHRLEWMPGGADDLDAGEEWLLELERELRPDVVHLNSLAWGDAPFRAPAIVVVHSCVLSWWWAVHGRAAPAEWSWYPERVRRSLHAANVVVAPTRAAMQWTQAVYGTIEGIRVVFNGRRPDLFRPGSKERCVLAAGRLWDEAKGLSTLAEAARDLPFPVRVAGSKTGPDGIDRELDHVEHLGVLASADLAAEMARAAVFAHPALYEPFGLGVLEAALSGCALVLSDLPSLRELWGGAALFVPPRKPDYWRLALERLLESDRDRERLATAARQRALRYTPAPMASRYRQVYREALQPRKRAPRERAAGRVAVPPTPWLGVVPRPVRAWRPRASLLRLRAL